MTAIRHARRRPVTPGAATWPGPLVEAIPRPRTGDGGIRIERDRRRRVARGRTPTGRFGRGALPWIVAVLGLVVVLVLTATFLLLVLGPTVIGADRPDAAPIGVALTGTLGGATASSAALAGSPGLFPGGAPTEVTATLHNPTGARFVPGLLRVVASNLRTACPADAWTVRSGDPTPALAPHGMTPVAVRVGLRRDAPDTCQGRTARLQLLAGIRPVGGHPPGPQAQATVTVRTATLGAPALGAAPIDGGIVLDTDPATATEPDRGPRADAVVIKAWGPDEGTQRTICRRVTAGSCRDVTGPAVSTQEYAVTARLGAHWTRQGPALRIHTPPPLPRLRGGSTVIVTTPPAAVGYSLQVLLDDQEAPLLQVDVPAETSITRALDTTALSPGRHSLLAITEHAGERTVGDPLTVVVGR